jgi:hypothetical protein
MLWMLAAGFTVKFKQNIDWSAKPARPVGGLIKSTILSFQVAIGG